MKLTQVLNKHILSRWYNDLWKQKKEVTVNNLKKLRQKLEAEGKQVDDAVHLFGGLQAQHERSASAVATESAWVDPPASTPSHSAPAYLYQGRDLLLGQRQAQAITNTIPVGDGLPERIIALDGLERLKNQDQLVTDVIRTSLMLDATQKKLPKSIDIMRLGLQQPAQYGIPAGRANRSLLAGLLSLCERQSGPRDALSSRAVLYRPHLQATNVTPDGHRVLLARRPELALLADCPLPAVAPADAVEASRASAAPELAPVSPYVHLHRVNEYRWQDVPPVSAACRHSYIHTLYLSWNSHLKHHVDDDQLGALSLMCMYAAALNMARQQVVSGPVTVQSVATDGRLVKFSVLQLNSTTVPETGAGPASCRGAVKNMLWTEPAAPLYQRCGYVEGRPCLEGYNEEVFPRLLALYTNGLLARTVDVTV